jgi:hypothetical protein
MANATYQVSSKMNDGRIFLIAGNTYDEFVANLQSALGEAGASNVLNTMAGSLEGANLSSYAQPSNFEGAVANLAAGLGASPAGPAQTFTPSMGPTDKQCKHGSMTKRTGAGAKGPWKAYMCPSPKGTPDQCEPVWVRRHDSDWNSF